MLVVGGPAQVGRGGTNRRGWGMKGGWHHGSKAFF